MFSKAQKHRAHSWGTFSVTDRCPGKSDGDTLQTGSACPKPDPSARAPRGTPSAPSGGELCRVTLLLTDVGDITLAELLPVLSSIQGPALINPDPRAGQERVLIFWFLSQSPECLGREEMLLNDVTPPRKPAFLPCALPPASLPQVTAVYSLTALCNTRAAQSCVSSQLGRSTLSLRGRVTILPGWPGKPTPCPTAACEILKGWPHLSLHHPGLQTWFTQENSRRA